MSTAPLFAITLRKVSVRRFLLFLRTSFPRYCASFSLTSERFNFQEILLLCIGHLVQQIFFVDFIYFGVFVIFWTLTIMSALFRSIEVLDDVEA